MAPKRDDSNVVRLGLNEPTDPVFEVGREDLPDDLKEKYDSVLLSLTSDARGKVGFGFLEQMMAERLALLHCVGQERARRGIGAPNPSAAGDPDAEPGFADFKEYQDFWKTWFDLASKLQRAQAQTVSAHNSIQMEHNRLSKVYSMMVSDLLNTTEVDLSQPTRERLRKMANEWLDVVYQTGNWERR